MVTFTRMFLFYLFKKIRNHKFLGKLQAYFFLNANMDKLIGSSGWITHKHWHASVYYTLNKLTNLTVTSLLWKPHLL